MPRIAAKQDSISSALIVHPLMDHRAIQCHSKPTQLIFDECIQGIEDQSPYCVRTGSVAPLRYSLSISTPPKLIGRRALFSTGPT